MMKKIFLCMLMLMLILTVSFTDYLMAAAQETKASLLWSIKC